MSQSFSHAASVLFAALTIPVDVPLDLQPEDLPQLLLGSGMRAHCVALVHHVLPLHEDMVGAILETKDGTFIPILGDVSEAVILAPNGEIDRPLELEDRQTITHAWVIEENLASLSVIVPFFSRYKSRFVEILVGALIINLFALVLPVFSSFVYDKILGNGITETLWALVIGLCLVVGIELCVRVLRITAVERFAIGSEVDIDHSTFRNLLDARANKMPSVGALLEKYKQVLSFRDFLSSSYLIALADLPFLVLFLLTIALVAGPLVLVALVCGSLMLLSSLIFTSSVLAYDQQSRKAGERRFGLMADILSAREAVIGGAFRNELSRQWGKASVTAATAASKARYWQGLGMSLVNSISFLSYVGVLVGGVYLIEAHELTSGGLLAASMLTSQTMRTVSSLVTLIIRYREFRIALRELNQITPPVPRINHKSCGHLNGGVRVEQIICRLHQGGAPVLNGVSLTIAPGEIVGIAGAPGAGKTTLLRLIAGVIHPDEGRILIDNIPLDRLAYDDISQNIGFKPQEFCLLDSTVEGNVRAGRAALSAKDRLELLNQSGLARAFQEGGLDWTTEIGPRGANISGGQRQLVALARAMLYHPALLLLDEPTNGLDAPLEAHLAQQLLNMRGKNTVIVSTHSRNILSICDRIIVIGQSQILADGPREKILIG